MRSHTYEITFRGQAGRTLRAQFDDCEVTTSPETTTLRAELPDLAAEYSTQSSYRQLPLK